MEILIQLNGPEDALPAGSPEDLDLLLGLNHKTTKARAIKMKYLKENAIAVKNYSAIEVKLVKELKRFNKNPAFDFKIYRHRNTFGFNTIVSSYSRFRIVPAWYEIKEIDTNKPWFIKTVRNEPNKSLYNEAADNIITDEHNKIINL